MLQSAPELKHDKSLQKKSQASSQKVKVIVRIRPFLKNENSESTCLKTTFDSVSVKNTYGETLNYKLDACYDSASQETIFSEQIIPFLQAVLDGKNSSIFAYGITGAGKTFTMQGTEEEPGIIPRSSKWLFDKLSGLNNMSGATVEKYYAVVSYMEVYNEKVYDLLSDKRTPLNIFLKSEDKIHVQNLQEIEIQDNSQFETLFTNAKRTVAATKFNESSSRSHAILRVQIFKKSDLYDQPLLIGKLQLIDLAGSEKLSDRIQESANINKSLFQFARVIEAINSGAPRIPYRDSALTRLLQDSLGGNSCSLMISNIVPCTHLASETTSTLDLASRTSKVINRVETNPTPPPQTDSAKARIQALNDWKLKKGKPITPIKESRNLKALIQPSPLKTTQNESSDRLPEESAMIDQISRKLYEKFRNDTQNATSPVHEWESRLSALEKQIFQSNSPMCDNARSTTDGVNDSNNSQNANSTEVMTETDDHIIPTIVREKIDKELTKTLNTDDLDGLLELKGIGKKRAQAIITYRNNCSIFEKFGDLTRVGLSERVVESIFRANAAVRLGI